MCAKWLSNSYKFLRTSYKPNNRVDKARERESLSFQFIQTSGGMEDAKLNRSGQNGLHRVNRECCYSSLQPS